MFVQLQRCNYWFIKTKHPNTCLNVGQQEMPGSNIIDIDEVLPKLTLQEKIRLISGHDMWHTSAVPRLGIPAARMCDGPNGVRGLKFSNSTPTACCPTGTLLGSSWNPKLLHEVGVMNGQQARAKGTQILMGPNLNTVRDPRNGRSYESASEDPVLSGWLFKEYCKGVQETGICICPKHLVCNDKEDYRMTLNVEVSERALREIYLMPFQIVQKECSPIMLMTGYSKVNGYFCSENKHILQDIAKTEWGFKGCFVSDWYGCVSTVNSIKNGLSLEMPGPSIWRGRFVEMSLFHNLLHEEVLDQRVKEVLRMVQATQKTGIPEGAKEGIKDDEETRKVLLQSAREGITLLKNENGILPLNKNKRTLLIGEACKIPTFCSGGCTYVVPYRAISPFTGVASKIGTDKTGYILGAPNRKVLPSFSTFAIDQTDKNPIKFCVYDDPRDVKGRKPVSTEWVPTVNATLGDYDGTKLRNINQLYANFCVDIKVPETTEYKFNLKVSGFAELYINNKLVAVNNKIHKVSSAFGEDAPEIYTVVPLSRKKTYKVEVEFASTLGKSSYITHYGYVLSGMARYLDVSKEISKAAEKAKEYEQVIVITGLNKDLESEGIDRKSMDLPLYQEELIEKMLEANANTVVVIESGTAVTLPFASKSRAIVHSGYLGDELGFALADVLFGDYCPDGKLPYTWPKKYEDHPSAPFDTVDLDFNIRYAEDIFEGYKYYDKKNIEPLYPFGYGLSYTTFELSNLIVELNDPLLRVSVDVKNTGIMRGKEVVQCYIAFKSDLIDRPEKELKGFTKIEVNQGSTGKSLIEIETKYATSFFNERLNCWTMEKGVYKVLVGTSSRDSSFLVGSFKIDKSRNWSGL